jgi:hypothetical protein
VIEDSEGRLRLVDGEARRVWWCEFCPTEIDESWKERAACLDVSSSEDFGSELKLERQRLISEYCDPCPVTLECLEYGAVDKHNWGMIFGGVYFVQDPSRRQKRIANKRKELTP